MEKSKKLSSVTKVFVQGSYRNRVNVRQDSDVDIGVLYTGNSFGVEYPPGTSGETFGNGLADYKYADFKHDVGQTLLAHFEQSFGKRNPLRKLRAQVNVPHQRQRGVSTDRRTCPRSGQFNEPFLHCLLPVQQSP